MNRAIILNQFAIHVNIFVVTSHERIGFWKKGVYGNIIHSRAVRIFSSAFDSYNRLQIIRDCQYYSTLRYLKIYFVIALSDYKYEHLMSRSLPWHVCIKKHFTITDKFNQEYRVPFNIAKFR